MIHAVPLEKVENSGIMFSNDIKENFQMNVLMYEYYHNGGGVAIGDINNDGLSDVYFSSTLFDNKLYLNKGDFKFEDVTERAGLECRGGLKTGVSMVDINSDGLLDIYVCQSGNFDSELRKNKLFVNNGDMSFTERSAEFGLDLDSYSTQAYFFDIDLDNDLDLFLVNHQTKAPLGSPASNAEVYDSLAGDKVLINKEGYFIDKSREYGIEQNAIGFGLSAAIADFNNDNYPDLYVCNDYLEHDYLYLNRGGKSFEESSDIAFRKTSFYSMGSDAADINADGWLDLYVADMAAADNYRIKTNMSGMDRKAFERSIDQGFGYQYMYNSFQINRGRAFDKELVFSEIGQRNELAQTDWSWAPLFLDIDNDADLDLYVTNGLRKEARNNDFVKKKNQYLQALASTPDREKQSQLLKELLDIMPSQKLHNYLFENKGDLNFINSSEKYGIFNDLSFSNGAAYGDLDNDGDLDLIINNIDEPAFVYRNNSVNNYLKCNFEGPEGNAFGLGVKLELTGEDGSKQYRTLNPARGYLSSVEPLLHFGLGNNSRIDKLDIFWPDGAVERKTDLVANKTIPIRYAEAKKREASEIKGAKPNEWLGKITELDIRHVENSFDDFDREVLLPHKLSAEGPACATADINSDGYTDVFIGCSLNEDASFYYNQEGHFIKDESEVWRQTRDMEIVDAEFFDLDSDGDLDLYLVHGGNEKDREDAYGDLVLINNGSGGFAKQQASPAVHSGSCLAIADFDKDGDEDLFVGGRSKPGYYGYAGHSYLLENCAGKLKDISSDSMPQLRNVGMITDALWSDYDHDGWLDLIVVGEWMPIKVFINKKGVLDINFIEIPQSSGWWYCLKEADFNQDGYTDYFLGNLGMNYKYKARSGEEFKMYVSDFDGNNSHDIVLSYTQGSEEYPLRGRECSSEQIPDIKKKFPDYHSFAIASTEEVYSPQKLNSATKLSVSTFKHKILLSNASGAYALEDFCETAQLFTIKDIHVTDLNGDKHLDIIACGNHYNSEAETPRSDASYVEIYYGNGKGGFKNELSKDHLGVEGMVTKIVSTELNSQSSEALLLILNNDHHKLILLN